MLYDLTKRQTDAFWFLNYLISVYLIVKGLYLCFYDRRHINLIKKKKTFPWLEIPMFFLLQALQMDFWWIPWLASVGLHSYMGNIWTFSCTRLSGRNLFYSTWAEGWTKISKVPPNSVILWSMSYILVMIRKLIRNLFQCITIKAKGLRTPSAAFVSFARSIYHLLPRSPWGHHLLWSHFLYELHP